MSCFCAFLIRFAQYSLLLRYEFTRALTTRSYTGAAFNFLAAVARLQFAAQRIELLVLICSARVAAHLGTLRLIKPAVTLLAVLHDLVPTEGAVALLEAVVLLAVRHRVQDGADVLDRAGAELVVVVPVPAGGAGEHDVVAGSSPRPALSWVVVRRPEVVANLVSQGQLGDLGGDSGVVVDKSYYARVEAPLCGVMYPVDILSVGFVFLTDSSARPRGRGHPGEAECAASEVSVSEDVGQAEVGVVLLTVQVQEVRHVNIAHTERILWLAVTIRVVQYFDSVDLEGVSSVTIVACVELCVSVDPVDGLDVLSHDGEDLLLGLGVRLLLLPHVLPQERVGLYEQRARLLGG